MIGEFPYEEKYSPIRDFDSSEPNENESDQLSHDEKILKTLIIDLLNLSGCIQKRVAHDENLIKFSMSVIADVFLCSDNTSRKNIFYIVNNLVQYDTRFRLSLLNDLIPEIAWCIANLPDNSVYKKTVVTWEQRNIYPYEVCKAIETAFSSHAISELLTTEYNQRLHSLTDIIHTRSAKDNALSKHVCETENTEDIAKAIVNASTQDLKEMTAMCQGVLVTTQNTIAYVNRLLLDFKSGYSDFHEMYMQSLQKVIDKVEPSSMN